MSRSTVLRFTHSDPIADLLARLRNAGSAGLAHTDIPSSKQKANILGILEREGYIAGFEHLEVEGPQPQLRVHLKYDADRRPIINAAKRVSKPGRRLYTRARDIPLIRGGTGIAIISTSQGIMTGRQAYRRKLGGEHICSVW